MRRSACTTWALPTVGLEHSQSVEQRKQIIAEAAEQRYVEFTAGATKYTSGTAHELNEKTDPVQREFYDFYRTPRGEYTPRGSSPRLTTHPTLTSAIKLMNFYTLADIDTISPRPMLFITGDDSHSREFSEEAYGLGLDIVRRIDWHVNRRDWSLFLAQATSIFTTA